MTSRWVSVLAEVDGTEFPEIDLAAVGDVLAELPEDEFEDVATVDAQRGTRVNEY